MLCSQSVINIQFYLLNNTLFLNTITTRTKDKIKLRRDPQKLPYLADTINPLGIKEIIIETIEIKNAMKISDGNHFFILIIPIPQNTDNNEKAKAIKI